MKHLLHTLQGIYLFGSSHFSFSRITGFSAAGAHFPSFLLDGASAASPMGERPVRPADAASGHRARRLSRPAPQSPPDLFFFLSLSRTTRSSPQYRAAGRAESVQLRAWRREIVNLRAAPPMDLSVGVMMAGADLRPLRRHLHSH
jgi:hypothetical protein